MALEGVSMTELFSFFAYLVSSSDGLIRLVVILLIGVLSLLPLLSVLALGYMIYLRINGRKDIRTMYPWPIMAVYMFAIPGFMAMFLFSPFYRADFDAWFYWPEYTTAFVILLYLIFVLPAVHLWAAFGWRRDKIEKDRQAEQQVQLQETQRIEAQKTAAIADFTKALRVAPSLVPHFKSAFELYYYDWAKTSILPATVADHASRFTHYLPPHQLVAYSRQGRPISSYYRALEDEPIIHQLSGMFAEFMAIPIRIVIPAALRTEHHQIIASPGHGKSQCISNMILDDLETDAAIVVIDSQGDLINSLATRVPADRLILIDPETCPPALNIFANGVKGEQETATAIELYEYIFSALDAKMTGKQALVYRYLSRLCMTVFGATINTMRDMLQPGGLVDYQKEIDQLGNNARAFFAEFQQPKNNQYSDTRQEVLRRLLMVLEGETFSRMLAAREMKINLAREIDAGKVILISTNKKLLKGGSSLLGRIFLAQVMQAVMSRAPGARRRTYLYIDEFADYAEDSHVLLDLFSQGRKYELGMVVCHQNLDQLTPKLAAAISSSTAIKFAGGVSSTDAGTLANQMRTDKLMIDRQRKGTFLAYFKDIGVMPWPVDFGRIDRTPEVTDLRKVQARMRKLYGEEPMPQKTPAVQDDAEGAEGDDTQPAADGFKEAF